MNESIAKSNTRLHEQSEEVLTLKDGITSLGATIDSQNQVIQKQQVRLDEGSEAREEAVGRISGEFGKVHIPVMINPTINPQEDK